MVGKRTCGDSIREEPKDSDMKYRSHERDHIVGRL